MSLETLPLELQIEIFSQYPETSIIGLQLSKTLQLAANEACLKTVWLNPISKTEFKNYLETEPKIFGRIFGNAQDLIDDRILFANISMLQNFSSDRPEWASTSFGPSYDDHQIDIFYSHETTSWEDERLDKIKDLCLANVNTYDILTTYRILKRRKGCMLIDPQYAKKRALAVFDEICTKSDGLNLIYLHLYLSMHVWIFNLDLAMNCYNLTYDNKTKTFDDEDSVSDIAEDNDILIKQIRKYLLIQD